MAHCYSFEAFDDLLLMKIGGQVIYHGELGQRSSKLVAFFEVRSWVRVSLLSLLCSFRLTRLQAGILSQLSCMPC